MKVHIVKWAASGEIGAVYKDYEKACNIAEKSNQKRTWGRKLAGALAGENAKWVVQTFDVRE